MLGAFGSVYSLLLTPESFLRFTGLFRTVSPLRCPPSSVLEHQTQARDVEIKVLFSSMQVASGLAPAYLCCQEKPSSFQMHS